MWLADLLNAYYNARNSGAWSQKAKVNHLKEFSITVNYLTEDGISTLWAIAWSITALDF